jgi:hypothetical protein
LTPVTRAKMPTVVSTSIPEQPCHLKLQFTACSLLDSRERKKMSGENSWVHVVSAVGSIQLAAAAKKVKWQQQPRSEAYPFSWYCTTKAVSKCYRAWCEFSMVTVYLLCPSYLRRLSPWTLTYLRRLFILTLRNTTTPVDHRALLTHLRAPKHRCFDFFLFFI